METKIQLFLKDLSIKLNKDSDFISNIFSAKDIDKLANIALVLFDDALSNKKMGMYVNDFNLLSDMFMLFLNVNQARREDVYTRLSKILKKLKKGFIDGNFRIDFPSKPTCFKFKVLIEEKEFSDILLDFYNCVGEIFYPTDRALPELAKYFFHDNADAVMYDEKGDVAVALISYCRNALGNIVLREYFINTKGNVDYNERSLSTYLEALLYDETDSGVKVESYEKMYLDALKEGGVSAFLEVVNIRKKIDLKRLASIRAIVANNKYGIERSDLNGLQQIGKPIISKC